MFQYYNLYISACDDNQISSLVCMNDTTVSTKYYDTKSTTYLDKYSINCCFYSRVFLFLDNCN